MSHSQRWRLSMKEHGWRQVVVRKWLRIWFWGATLSAAIAFFIGITGTQRTDRPEDVGFYYATSSLERPGSSSLAWDLPQGVVENLKSSPNFEVITDPKEIARIGADFVELTDPEERSRHFESMSRSVEAREMNVAGEKENRALYGKLLLTWMAAVGGALALGCAASLVRKIEHGRASSGTFDGHAILSSSESGVVSRARRTRLRIVYGASWVLVWLIFATAERPFGFREFLWVFGSGRIYGIEWAALFVGIAAVFYQDIITWVNQPIDQTEAASALIRCQNCGQVNRVPPSPIAKGRALCGKCKERL